MKTTLALALTVCCGAAGAQSPAANPMPDGSRDMYVGLGIQSTPRYEGASERRIKALPVLQFQWSNGVFIAGPSLGMHLSSLPQWEFGPSLSLLAGRTESGTSTTPGDVDKTGDVLPGSGLTPAPIPPVITAKTNSVNRLVGMTEIKTRLAVGGFVNYYLNPQMRWTNSLSYGAGNEHKGARWSTDLQFLPVQEGGRHAVSASIGLSFANAAYNQAYYGVTLDEAKRSLNPLYTPGGGLKDVHAGLRWNWKLSPSWLISSGLGVVHMQGSAADSPLVLRSTNVSASSALAYRF